MQSGFKETNTFTLLMFSVSLKPLFDLHDSILQASLKEPRIRNLLLHYQQELRKQDKVFYCQLVGQFKKAVVQQVPNFRSRIAVQNQHSLSGKAANSEFI